MTTIITYDDSNLHLPNGHEIEYFSPEVEMRCRQKNYTDYEINQLKSEFLIGDVETAMSYWSTLHINNTDTEVYQILAQSIKENL